MSTHFISVIKSYIQENKLQDLSSEGWKRMRDIERALDDKRIEKDDAIKSFLAERDFRLKIDRHGIEDLKRMLR